MGTDVDTVEWCDDSVEELETLITRFAVVGR
jgi:hypothetical protein